MTATKKPERTYRFTPGPCPSGPHVVKITEKKGRKTEIKSYHLTEFPADGGRGFKWETFESDGGNIYEVFISDNTDEEPNRCCCKGHEQHGHKTVCRHIACTLSLMERDRI
jgi:hypothetical protein